MTDSLESMKKLQQLNSGRTANVVLDNIKPELDALRSESIEKSKILFRTGDHQLAAYMACAAQLCSLDDLEAKLRQKINVGVRAAEALAPNNNPERQS
jgi:hypothetical protein